MKLLAPVILVSIPLRIYAAGGIAELKSLTGDQPYLGWGNQEQAPEFFASQLYSRYYNGDPYPYTRYGRTWANRYPYYDYMQRYGYGGYPGGGGGFGGGCMGGCHLAQRSAYNIRYSPKTVSSSIESPEIPEPIQPVVAAPAPAPAPVPSGGGGGGLGLGGIYQGRGNEWVNQKKS